MRERSFFKRADWILWTFLALFPLIVYLLNIGQAVNYSSFQDFMSYLGMNDQYIIYQIIDSFIGSDGYVPLIDNPGIISYLTYFSACSIAHMMVDIITFFPTLCHDLVDHFWSK